MFEKLDLTELSDADIHLVTEAFRILATQHNRFALDVLIVMLKETCRRHDPQTSTRNYTDQELANVMAVLTTMIDKARECGADDGLPMMQTLLLMSTAVIDELEERGCVVSQLQ